MQKHNSFKFSGIIEIIGINPFVFIPDNILRKIFLQAKKDKGPIPVAGIVEGKPYKQTLVKYAGHWRLYINTTMIKDSPKRIGEKIEITIQFDSVDRTITPHPELIKALEENHIANEAFRKLPPSTRKEITRYISNLKSRESIEKNIDKAIKFLLGEGSFAGRNMK